MNFRNLSENTLPIWRNPWRLAGWGLIFTLLFMPAVAMQFTNEVNWTMSDFAIATFLLCGTGGCIEMGCRYSKSLSARAGWALTVLSSLLLIWINLAVGIIGSEENPANLLYLLVLTVVGLGALWARFQAAAMSVVLIMTAVLQLAIELVLLYSGLGSAPVLNIAFALLWLLAAALLRHSQTLSSADKAGA